MTNKKDTAQVAQVDNVQEWDIVEKSSPFFVGLAADTVLRIAKLSGRKETRGPEQLGKNQFGEIVKWHFSDVLLTLSRKAHRSPYVVTKIEIKRKNKAISK